MPFRLPRVFLLAAMLSPGAVSAAPFTVTIDGHDAIFLAGRTDVTIPPASQPWPGGLQRSPNPTPEELLETLPPIFALPANATVDVVQPATGLVSYTQGFGAGQLNPDGDGFTGSANMAPFGG
ncbi:MAG: PEP-CTERM sorting domain-containing protein, partial [Planctomycetota bacterium]